MLDYLTRLHPFYVAAAAKLELFDLLELTEAMAHILNAIPADQILEPLQQFVLPIIVKLQECCAAKRQGAASDLVIEKQLEALLKQFNVFVKHINPKLNGASNHPFISILTEMWTVIDEILTLFGSTSVLISEAISKML